MSHPSERASTKTTFKQPGNPWIEGVKTIALSIVFALGTRAYIAEARLIYPTGSMEPTLEINDRVIIEKVSYRFDQPKRGDIVVFAPPQVLEEQNFRGDLIKRVIGLPGDFVEVKDGKVFVNGKVLSENYTKEAANYELNLVKVPQDRYLVLGDNRNNSSDSHVWGFVPREKIIGRAVVRYWPPNRAGRIEPLPSYRQK